MQKSIVWNFGKLSTLKFCNQKPTFKREFLNKIAARTTCPELAQSELVEPVEGVGDAPIFLALQKLLKMQSCKD